MQNWGALFFAAHFSPISRGKISQDCLVTLPVGSQPSTVHCRSHFIRPLGVAPHGAFGALPGWILSFFPVKFVVFFNFFSYKVRTLDPKSCNKKTDLGEIITVKQHIFHGFGGVSCNRQSCGIHEMHIGYTGVTEGL